MHYLNEKPRRVARHCCNTSETGLGSRMCTPETPPRKSLQNLNGISSFGEPADNGPSFCLCLLEIPSRVFLALRPSPDGLFEPSFPNYPSSRTCFQRSELLDGYLFCLLFVKRRVHAANYAPEVEAGSLRDHPGYATRLGLHPLCVQSTRG